MIINKKSAVFLKELPFSPRFNTKRMTVQFYYGYIFDCYNSYSNDNLKISEASNVFSQGPHVYESTTTEFAFEFDDHFFLDSDGTIFKLTKKQREDYIYMRNRFRDYFPNYLIWIAPSNAKAGGRSVLSENIFLQDKNSGQRKGFTKHVIAKNRDGSLRKRLYGGCFVIGNGHYQEFIKGLDYDIAKDETDKGFAIKLKLDAIIKFGFAQALDGETYYISNFNVTSVALVEMIPNKDYSNEIATVDSPSGVYYFPLTGSGNFSVIFDLNYDDIIDVSSTQRLNILTSGFSS